MFSGLQLAAVTLLALIAISQPALAANRRFLRDIDTTSPVQLLQSSVSELIDAENIRGRLLQQVTGQRGAMAATGRATGAGESARPVNAQPLSGTSTSGTVGTSGSNEPLAATTNLRSTTGGTSTLVGAAGGNAGTAPGRVSIDGTQSDAALAGTSMRSVTNGNAGYVGNNNAGTVSTESGINGPHSEGTVAADVMPSATNQGGGVRPGGDGNLAMESMPSSGSAMSMRSEP